MKYLFNSSLQSQQPSYSDYSYSISSGSRIDLLRTVSHLLAVKCILAGTILMTISWGVIQLLFFFYRAQTDSQNQRSLWRVVREFVTDLPTSTLQLKAKLAIGELIRLCTIPLLIPSAVGWSVCTAGLYKLTDRAAMYLYAITYSHYYDFGTWAVFFITPLLYLFSLLHA